MPLCKLTPVANVPSADSRFGTGWNVDILLCSSWMFTKVGVADWLFQEMVFGPVGKLIRMPVIVVGCNTSLRLSS